MCRFQKFGQDLKIYTVTIATGKQWPEGDLVCLLQALSLYG